MIELAQALEIWREMVNESFFLGEISLSREETEIFLRELREHLKTLEVEDLEFALTLLAVNCAYHYYDESGFWQPFSRFFTAATDTQNQQWIGVYIEEFLERYRRKRKRKFVQRSGPFRYVGHILEECGISLYYMEDFVNFLKLHGHGLNFKKFLSLNFEEYKARIPQDMRNFLHKFLADESGWRFCRDVARTLDQYGRGILKLEDICQQRGYHPDFWNEFFTYFDSQIYSQLKPKHLPQRPVWRNFGNQDAGRGLRSGWNRAWSAQPRFGLVGNIPERAPHIAGYTYVYFKPFGNLQIYNSEGVLSGAWIIVAKINGREKAVPPASLIQNDDGTFLNLDELVRETQAAKIELWVEPVGRMTEGSGNSHWQCALLDKFAIVVDPDNLAMPESEVRVNLAGPQIYSLHFPHPGRRLNDHEWAIPAWPAPAGKLLAGDLEFELDIPVYADVVRIKDTHSKILCAPQDLRAGIVIEGKPGSELQLVAKNEHGEFPFSSLAGGFFFGTNGQLEISTENYLLDELEAVQGSWALISQGTGTLTGALVYIDLRRLLVDLKNLHAYPRMFFEALPGKSGEILQKLVPTSVGKLPEPFDAHNLKNLNPKLVLIGALYAAGSAIFENLPINNLDNEIFALLPQETVNVLRWYMFAQKADTHSAKEELDALVLANINPNAVFVPEWIEKVREEKARIENLKDILDNPEKIIELWMKEVLGAHNKNQYESYIARMDGGQELTQHWRDFLKKRNEPKKLGGIYKSLEPLRAKPGIVSALVQLLGCAILKKTGREDLITLNPEALPEILRPAAAKIVDDSLRCASILDPLL